MYEIRVPKKILKSEGDVGFTMEMYFGSANDDLVQLVDGVTWPPKSDRKSPSEWGVLSLPSVQCREGLETAFKTSNNQQICIKPESREKLYKWTQCDVMVMKSGNRYNANDELVRPFLEITDCVKPKNQPVQ